MTKQANGDGSVFQRTRKDKNGHEYKVWTGMLSLPDGRCRTVSGESKKDVKAKLAALKAEAERGVDLGTPKQSVGAFLDRWLADVVKPTVRPRTYDGYAQHVRDHLKPALGKIELSRLNGQHVQAMLNQLSATHAPMTVVHVRATLRRALGQALKW